MNSILTVSELNRLIKTKLESEFREFSITGEISNFKPHNSGHWYFSIKDESSQISCTMWRTRNQLVYFTPSDGMKVIIYGRISVYEVRGSYQIDVIKMYPLGVGELQIAFEKLKEKLSKENLFNDQFKKPIPLIPLNIGVITSIDGAAIKDVLSVVRRRFPVATVFIRNTLVQGASASEDIVKAIKEFNEFKEVDVIILCRGGGSLEDLWPFNEEITARAIFKSTIPIVTGIGHEIDTTISDLVADLRASTPTAAAERITPELKNLISYLYDFHERNKSLITSFFKSKKINLLNYRNRYSFIVPESKINTRKQNIDLLLFKINNSISNIIQNKKNKIFTILKVINNSDPLKIMEKGFTIIKQNGKFIKKKTELNSNLEFSINFCDGEIKINE